ncbi:MAG: matrixin family metalloprotease [Planctomycetota bacterium]|nr:matrixin family metalloprotease [Planctomycetota bacterium]
MGTALLCLLFATACGGGGGPTSAGVPGSGATHPVVAVAYQALPTLSVGEPLEGFQLQASTPTGNAPQWFLHSGQPAPGIELQPDGVLAGTPTQAGVFAFEARVVDGMYASVIGLALAVDDFGLYVRRGLVAGDAVEGHTIELATVGAAGGVTFDAVGPGGFASQDQTTGTATYVAGIAAHVGTIEFIALDAEGNEARLVLELRPDVTAGFVAEWGATDVWHLDLDVRLGDHDFATDFHAALAEAGLRDSESTSLVGTAADQLAERCVRVALHREMSTYFLREPDGSPGVDGLAISFAYEEPGAGYLKPTPGTYMGGGPNRFSVVAFCDGTRGGVVGTAFVDDPGNPRHENDTTGGDGEYGVFLNTITPYFNGSWSNQSIRYDAVSDDDIDTLRAILYGESVHGPRAAELERVVNGYGRALATVAAHEIGHSLGLLHTTPSTSNSLMNAYASIGPHAEPAFLPSRVEVLRAVLPGLGRGGWSPLMSGAQQKTTLPGGGIAVCSGGCCELRLPVTEER